MEPRTSSPTRRIEAIQKLAEAGISVGVCTAPLIPGINDEEMPAVIAAASDAGASFASYTIVRLPHSVEDIFLNWLQREFPSRREKVIARLRSLGGGQIRRSEFGVRMGGEGPWSEQIRGLFRLACRKAGIENSPKKLSTDHFRRTGGRQLTFLDSLVE
jgi:DNA repair photolyase